MEAGPDEIGAAHVLTSAVCHNAAPRSPRRHRNGGQEAQNGPFCREIPVSSVKCGIKDVVLTCVFDNESSLASEAQPGGCEHEIYSALYYTCPMFEVPLYILMNFT